MTPRGLDADATHEGIDPGEIGTTRQRGVAPRLFQRRRAGLGLVEHLGQRHLATLDRQQARTAFAASPAGDLKVLVFHHNLLRGDLSQRWGLVARAQGIRDAHATGAQLVLNGHDHQTRIEGVELDGRTMVVSASTSFCARTRGGLASAFNEIEVAPDRLTLRACTWDAARGDFTPRQDRIFRR